MKINHVKEIYNQLVTPVEIKEIETDSQFPGSKTYKIDCSSNQAKVMSWGAHNFKRFDDLTLQFAVNGALFKGLVRIVYDLGEDLYNIQLVSLDSNGVSKIHHEHKGVYFDEMHDIIDAYVERDNHI